MIRSYVAPWVCSYLFHCVIKSVSHQDEVFLILIHISMAFPGVCSPGALLEGVRDDESVNHTELLQTLTPLIFITSASAFQSPMTTEHLSDLTILMAFSIS